MERKGGDDDERTSAAAAATVVDHLSGLPEDILHHILSSLDTKEVIKTSVLSKRFMSLWLSFPVLDFESYNYPRHGYETIRKAKDEYLDRINRITQQRCQNAEAPFLQKYRLCFDGSYTDNRINAAINYAIKCGRVKELALLTDDRFSLPDIAFETSITSLTLAGLKVNKLSEFLGHCPGLENLELINCYASKSIKISGSKIKFIYLEVYRGSESIEIHSPALQVLNFYNMGCYKTFSISNSCNSLKEMNLWRALVTDKWIQELLPRLVLLEKLSFFWCGELKNIKISNPNLKSVALTRCQGLVCTEVRVLDLESFKYEDSLKNDPGTCKINIVHCKHLRQLSMHGCGFLEEFLQEQVPQLLELERLKLDYSSFKGSVEIYHQNLMHLEISNWRTVLKIDTPKLVSFSYHGSCIPFVSFQYNAIISAKLELACDYDDDPSFFKNWYELIRFMDRCKVLKLGGAARNFIFPQQLRKGLVSPLVNLKHMRVEITWLGISVALVDSLLWLSPFLETLDFVGRVEDERILSIKFQYMWTENKDDENPSVVVSDQSVRHYSYREVEIEIFRDLVIEKDDLVKYFKDEVKSLRLPKKK